MQRDFNSESASVMRLVWWQDCSLTLWSPRVEERRKQFLTHMLSRGWFRSIDLWVMGPARFRCATLLCISLNGIWTCLSIRPLGLMLTLWQGSAEIRKMSFDLTDSRGWFRSIDLWVMGPARFRCATLLSAMLAFFVYILKTEYASKIINCYLLALLSHFSRNLKVRYKLTSFIVRFTFGVSLNILKLFIH